MSSEPTTMTSAAMIDRDISWIDIDLAEWQRRKRFINFNTEDSRALVAIAPLVERHANQIVEGFYHHIAAYPELQQLIEHAGSSIDRLRITLRQYLIGLVSGDYGKGYLEQRLRVGVVHYRVGLAAHWYLGSFSYYRLQLLPLIDHHYRWCSGKRRAAQQALTKLLALDEQLAMDTYIAAMQQALQQVTLSKSAVEKNIANYRHFVARIATGDLSSQVQVPEQTEGELMALGDQLNQMARSLAEIARQVADASGSTTDAATRLQESIAAQSTGAAQQARAVSETATTLEEIRATSNQTRDKARSLAQSAERTREEGKRGEQMVERTIGAMEDIRGRVESIARNILVLSEQSQQIGEITNLVSGIAQQLKILALNASIEASKVGEAGRGFAVVAGEVRSLAQQSHDATSQIHNVLQDIQRATERSVMATEEGAKGVDQGMQLVEQTGVAMQDLTRVIKETALAGQHIMSAVSQEATGIDQISSAMREISSTTDQFLDATEQTRETAQRLAEMANRLRDRAAIYKL